MDRRVIETLRDRAWRASKSAFIYTSGVWVLGSSREPMDESAPVNPTPHVAWRAEHEPLVLEANGGGMRAIVVRPGIVYGGSDGIISGMLREADNSIMRVIGSGENHWPMVYDRDLADLYVKLVAHPDASGIFHATDDGEERVIDLVKAMSRHVEFTPEIRYMPLPEARAKLGTYADALALDQIVRSPRARDRLASDPEVREPQRAASLRRMAQRPRMIVHAARVAIVAVALTAAAGAVAGPAASGTAIAIGQSAPPADDASARVRLEESSRHGEYVDIAVSGRVKPINAFVVYPEIATKAPVVVVTHENDQLTDWVRGVADQLAADGFIAIAPDLLTGKAATGGGSEEREAALRAVHAYGSKLPASSGKTSPVVLQGAPRILENWAATVANLRKQTQ